MLYDIIVILWLHFVADFVLQTDYVACNKSKNNKILALHAAIYAVPLVLFGVSFALVNSVAHFVVDWCTSRATSYLWQHEKRHLFFVVIGFDQAVHATCLILTYMWLAT